MSEPGDGRVAVYIDFDNIVISRYDQVHGRGTFMRDRQKSPGAKDAAFRAKLAEATVDVGAVIDFASSFGTLVLTRAYADWSAAVNAEYRGQLVGRAVDLVQLFPAAAYAKNGADIRLAVDAVEDLFRLPDLTHVVIVAGDSDYIALAQRCKRLGRYVVGIGVAGSTSKALAAACDDFVTYDDLPGIARVDADVEEEAATETAMATRAGEVREVSAATDVTAAADVTAATEASPADATEGAPAAPRGSRGRGRKATTRPSADAEPEVVATAPAPTGDTDQTEDLDGQDESAEEREDPQISATRLLTRALQLGHEKDDSEWLHSSQVKNQMKRMDPSFSEKSLGFRSFSDFVKSRSTLVELDDSSTIQMMRLAPRKSRRVQHSGRAS